MERCSDLYVDFLVFRQKKSKATDYTRELFKTTCDDFIYPLRDMKQAFNKQVNEGDPNRLSRILCGEEGDGDEDVARGVVQRLDKMVPTTVTISSFNPFVVSRIEGKSHGVSRKWIRFKS